MKRTKNWGTVSGSAELYMLNHAEHTHERMTKKDKGDKHNAMVSDHTNSNIHSR